MEKLTFPEIAKRIPDEASAYEFLERLRWRGRPVCPHCGSINEHYFLKPRNGERVTNRGNVTQRRLWKCRDCRMKFSVLTGTVMHGSHIPARTWVLVFYELCANKNGLAAREVERKYGLAPKSAWFMLHRIREAMKREPLADLLAGNVVADETYIGGKDKNRHAAKRTGKSGRGVDKVSVLSLINEETGEVRSRVIPNVTRETLGAAIRENVELPLSVLHSDSWAGYVPVGKEMRVHHTVDHNQGQYVTKHSRGTNMAENYFSQLERVN